MLKIGSSFGSYQVAEASNERLRLQPDYKMGAVILVMGLVFLLLDILIIPSSTRHLLWWAPNWFKGAMFILPPIGIGWFFVMTGRSILIDAAAGVARRTKYFFFGDPASLVEVTAVELEMDKETAVTAGQYVKLNLIAKDGRKIFEIANEKASGDEFDSLPTTDFAMLLEIAQHVSGMLKMPLKIHGDPAKMSAKNQKMLHDAEAGRPELS